MNPCQGRQALGSGLNMTDGPVIRPEPLELGDGREGHAAVECCDRIGRH